MPQQTESRAMQLVDRVCYLLDHPRALLNSLGVLVGRVMLVIAKPLDSSEHPTKDSSLEKAEQALNALSQETEAETLTPRERVQLSVELLCRVNQYPVSRWVYRNSRWVYIKPARTGSLLRFWRLFSFALPRQVRLRVFEPAYNDMLEVYLQTRGRYRTKAARRWLAFVYTFKTFCMVLDCLYEMSKSKCVSLLWGLVPEMLKQWWRIP